MESFGLSRLGARVPGHRRERRRCTIEELEDLAAEADLLVNISGNICGARRSWAASASRAYVDLDPGFTQIWHAQGADRGSTAHDTLLHRRARTSGAPGCDDPDGRIDWHAAAAAGRARGLARRRSADPGRFTDGRRLARRVRAGRARRAHATGSRCTSSARSSSCRSACPLTVRARARHPSRRRQGPRRRCARTAGSWSIRARRPAGRSSSATTSRDRGPSSRSPRASTSRPAAGGSATARSRYLASGKPALVQDTGFSDNYPVGGGTGRLPHSRGGRRRCAADRHAYDSAHAAAARALAEERFDSDRVLARFLEQALG